MAFVEEIPLLRILMLKDWDRVNIAFWPVFFAFLFIIIGLAFSFFNLLIWTGGFVILAYLILIGVFVWEGLK